MHTIFVYGTLRKNQSNSSYLKKSEFIGFDWINGFIMLDFGSYPMIFESEKDNMIKVEIYRVADYTLEQIDRLEEYYGEGSIDNLYSRQQVESLSGIRGFIYTGGNLNDYKKSDIIMSGDWLDRF